MKIDFSETFPHLDHAPIVEAVIDFRAKPSVPWNPDELQTQLKQELPGYPTVEPQRGLQLEIKAEAGKPPKQQALDLGCVGLRFRSQDKLQVGQFQKGGFAFARLRPYERWETFEAEALRLWKIYLGLARPVAVQRVGVRFINRMLFLRDGFRLDDYVVGSAHPLPALEWRRANFLHRDTLVVPETNYLVNLTRTVQPAEGEPASIPIILDIDVFTNAPMELNDGLLQTRLTEMRWLKNKVFFASITAKTKGMFQ